MSIEKKIKDVIALVFKVNEDQLTRETEFVKDLEAQSYDIAELIALLEEEFQIEIDPLRARQNKSVGQAIDYIEELAGK